MAQIILSPAQIEAVNKMDNGKILCGKVGSGKSRTALAYYYKSQGGVIHSVEEVCNPIPEPMNSPCDLYIITTAKKRDTLEWDNEMIPFLLSQNPELNGYSNKVVVDSWNSISKYSTVRNAFFIFDEQRVVGKGAWVKAFLKIAKANSWILLSATPGDKWEDYIPVFLANGFYKNRTEFNQTHLIFSPYISNFPKVTGYMGVRRLERLRDSLLVDIPVENITEKHYEDIYVDYDRKAYKDISKTRWNPYKEKPIENAAEYCYCLRRLVNTDISRQIKLLELLEDKDRAIIFYNLTCELDILKTILQPFKDNGYSIAECNGERHDAIPDTDKWLYLVQYQAGAEGWNCIATNVIIFYSLNYSYRTMEQAAGRIDRMNTRFAHLYYYYIKTHSGIDNSISKALSEKKKFNEAKFSKSFFGEVMRKG